MNRKPTSRRFLPFLTLAATLCLSALAFAETPAPATTGTPPTAPAATAPTTPPAPANTPAPAATTPDPARRKEDEQTAADAPAPGATATPSIFDRAAAYMKGKDGLAAEISAHKKRADDAVSALATANATIAAQNTELAELRAGKAGLESAVAALEGKEADVPATVATIGFPAAALPAPATVEAAGESGESLLAQFRAEKDAGKKGELFAKWQATQAKQKASN